jgi:hypothetical protein
VGEPAADYGPLSFGDSVCPGCDSHRVAVVASFGPTDVGYGSQYDVTVPETQFGRCEDCGESLRREVTAITAGIWQTTGF